MVGIMAVVKCHVWYVCHHSDSILSLPILLSRQTERALQKNGVVN